MRWMDRWMDMSTVRAMARRVGGLPAVAALVLVGAGALLAAPGHSNGQTPQGTPTVTSPTFGVQSHALVGAAGTPTDTPIPVATDTPTTAPQPTATPTQAPAATSTPVPPTPTATPAPTWHTVGSYSGSASQALPSFTTASPWRMNWTCTPGSGTTDAYSFAATVDGASLASFGSICNSATGATWSPCASASACDGSHTYAIVAGQNNGTYPVCAWTATIEEYY